MFKASTDQGNIMIYIVQTSLERLSTVEHWTVYSSFHDSTAINNVLLDLKISCIFLIVVKTVVKWNVFECAEAVSCASFVFIYKNIFVYKHGSPVSLSFLFTYMLSKMLYLFCYIFFVYHRINCRKFENENWKKNVFGWPDPNTALNQSELALLVFWTKTRIPWNQECWLNSSFNNHLIVHNILFLLVTQQHHCYLS